jgi:hypothetical protein
MSRSRGLPPIGTKGNVMTETPDPTERRHAEAPAEGEDTDTYEAPSVARVHAEEPAEGAAEKDRPGDGPSDDGPSEEAQADETS